MLTYDEQGNLVDDGRPETGFNSAMQSPYAAMFGTALSNLGVIAQGGTPQQQPFSAAFDVRRQNALLMDQKFQRVQQQRQWQEGARLRAMQETRAQQLIDAGTQAAANPEFSVVEMADGFEYYVDPTGRTPPRRVSPGMQLKPDASAPTGPFQGQGIDAGMLNIISNPDIPWSDPDKRAAAAWVSRPQTVQTPSGPMTIPGADLSMYGYTPGGDGGREGVYGQQNVPLTEGQAKDRGFYNSAVWANEQLIPLEQAGVAIDPKVLAGYLAGRENPTVGFAVNALMSPDERRYLDLIMDSGMIKLRDESGAALGNAEIALQLKQFITTTQDSPEQRADRSKRRQLAIDNYFKGGGRWSEEDRAKHQQMLDSWSQGGGQPPVPRTGEYDPNDARTW